MSDSATNKLFDAISEVAPIDGVAIGNLSDKATWRIDFKPEATQDQRNVANGILAAIDANAPTVRDVVKERLRRLSLGFIYDFQDGRGVHQIGTTPDDMTGWREVIDYANALVDLGDTGTQIAIVTDTGPTLVTAPEWQAVMLQAAQVRQVIWAKSFALQAMSPIPSDYENDSYWT